MISIFLWINTNEHELTRLGMRRVLKNKKNDTAVFFSDNNFSAIKAAEYDMIDLSTLGGEGFIKHLWTQHMHFVFFDMFLPEEIEYFMQHSDHMISMHFVTHGTVYGQERLNNVVYHFEANEHIILNRVEHEGFIQLPASKRLKGISIHVSADYIWGKLAILDETKLHPFVSNMNVPGSISDKNGNITAEMHYIIQQLQTADFSKSCINLFLESRVLELLRLQLEQFQRESNGISRDNAEKLAKVLDFLQKTPYQSTSLTEISKRFYINEKYLKSGFREVYGTTLFAYWRNFHLNEAHRKIALGCPVLEVAVQAGYDNVKSFTKAFKSFFGYTPYGLYRNL